MSGTPGSRTRTVSAGTVEAVLKMEHEVRALMRSIRRRSVQNARLVHPELPVSAYLVLRFVCDNESARACDVVEDLAMDKGAVSRHIALLRDLELIESRCHPEDRRVQTLHLSPVGRQKIDAVRADRQTQIAHGLESWTPAELSSFIAQLHRLNQVVED